MQISILIKYPDSFDYWLVTGELLEEKKLQHTNKILFIVLVGLLTVQISGSDVLIKPNEVRHWVLNFAFL